MRLRGVIARVLVVLASLNLVAGPVFAGAQSINLKAQGNLEGAKEAATKAKDAIAATDKVAQTGAKATRTFNILGDKPWGEAFQKGIFGGTKLTPANILEGALDGAITSGINSAVHGTSFKKGFTSSLIKNVVALGLADAQIGIGTVFNKKDADGNLVNGGEGSLGHILLHGAAGCAAAELTGADCAAGAAGGIAQAVYASALEGKGPNPLADPGGYAAWRARVSSHAEVIGAAVGYFASGGRAENVSAASSIARSGFENNYLTHEEERILALANKQNLTGECQADEVCIENAGAVVADLHALSGERDAQLRACQGRQSAACVGARLDLYKALVEYEEAIYLYPDLQGDLDHAFFFSRVAQQYARYADHRDFDSDAWVLDPADYTAPNAQLFAANDPDLDYTIGFAERRSIPGTAANSAEATGGIGYGVFLRALTRLGIAYKAPTIKQDRRIGTADQPITGQKTPLSQIDSPVDLVGFRRDHIMNRHGPGSGKSGKTEFPSGWDEQRIIHNISDVATDPNSRRIVSSHGTQVYGVRDGIEIRVDLYPDSHPRFPGQISTGFPVAGPNVPVNP